jgi:hypothetical protein
MRCVCTEKGKYRCDGYEVEIDYITIVKDHITVSNPLSCNSNDRVVEINDFKLIVLKIFDKVIDLVVYV